MQEITSFFKRNKLIITQFIIYGIIGVIASTIDVVVFSILSNHISIFISNAISVNIGITTSFFANTFINFKITDKIFRRALIFFSVGYLGLAISSGLLFVGVNLLEIEKLYVKVFTVFVVAIIQFILNKFITFKKDKNNG